MTVFVYALGLVAGKKIPVSDRQVQHHSTKKQLRPDVVRLTRGNEAAEGSDMDPALAYALPPSALLHHQGHGFGYGLGQGPEAAALAALVSSGLQQEGRQALAHFQRPVYHYSPLEQHALFAHAKPIEEPKQEEPTQVAHDVHAQAHSFVDSPNLYNQDTHEDEVGSSQVIYHKFLNSNVNLV